MANLDCKAAAALTGIIGSIVFCLLSTLGGLRRGSQKCAAIGHCCGYPASRCCSGLASETITKAPQCHPLPQEHKGRFLFFVGRRALSFLRRRAVVVGCADSRLVLRRLRPLVNGPGWWGDLSLECLITLGGDRLCLVYPRVVSDSRVWSGSLDLVVVPLDVARMECPVARRQIEPNPKHEAQGCGCILQCFPIARDATGNFNGRGNRVFDICQKLFLGVKSRPDLENIRLRLGLCSQDNPNICADRVIKTIHTRLREALRFVKNKRRPGSCDITVKTHGILRVEEWPWRHMRMSICPRWSHEGYPRSEASTSVVHLQPPVLFRRNGELSAKPLIGSGVITILVPWKRCCPFSH